MYFWACLRSVCVCPPFPCACFALPLQHMRPCTPPPPPAPAPLSPPLLSSVCPPQQHVPAPALHTRLHMTHCSFILMHAPRRRQRQSRDNSWQPGRPPRPASQLPIGPLAALLAVLSHRSPFLFASAPQLMLALNAAPPFVASLHGTDRACGATMARQPAVLCFAVQYTSLIEPQSVRARSAGIALLNFCTFCCFAENTIQPPG